jgi:hypothetical protein
LLAEKGEEMALKKGRHQRLLTCLMQYRTVGGAAAAAGVSVRHAWRLLSNPDFKTQIDEARERVFSEALGRVQTAIVDAATVLLNMANREDVSASVRVAAARTLLEAALQSWEIRNLERRLAALEERNEKTT